MSYAKAKAKHDAPVQDANGTPQELMCVAHGCPNRWSVEGGGSTGSRCCSAHAWVDKERWPEVTQEQQWHETERARMRGEPKQQPYVAPLTYAEKRALIAKLAKVGTGHREEAYP